MLLHLRSCEGSVSKDKKKGPSKAKIEKKTEKPSKKASFKRSGGTSKKSCLKAHIKTAPPNAGAGRAHFGQSVVPRQAWPDPERKNLGKHSYTLERGGACLEVLLLKQAYRLAGRSLVARSMRGRLLAHGQDTTTRARR